MACFHIAGITCPECSPAINWSYIGWPSALDYHDCTGGKGKPEHRLADADVERIAEAVLQKMLEREQVRAFADAGLTAAAVARELSPADLEALRRMDGT